MSSTGVEDRGGHPIAWFASRLHRVLDELVEAPAWSMTGAEQRTSLVELARAEARLTELRLRVLAAGDRNDIAAESGATSTAAWVAHATRQPRAAARADLRLATRLDTAATATGTATGAATGAALAAGDLDVAQARVIVRAIDALPDTVPGEVRARAERHLITLAGEHDAITLAVLGRRVLEVIDPETAEEEEGRKLAAEEAAAARATYLHLFHHSDGTSTGRFKIPTLHAAMLTKMLQAFLTPTNTST
ncbi:MAG TPA: DUF222 domain-containing protein, partial [Nocardioidaceae bacterium]|nr:DUF222 domain-containing protein [Nocardioidaceae bacterium]